MIGAFLVGWSSLAWGVTRTVNSTADTNTGTGAPGYTGTLRYHLNNAAAGDLIVFASNFSSNPPTTITVTTALPTLNDAGVILDGDDRVAIACASAMTTGNGLTVNANDVTVLDLEVRDCPWDGIRVSGRDVELTGNLVHHNDQSGVNVTGLSTNTSSTYLMTNEAHHNCGAPAGLSCAGFHRQEGHGQWGGPLRSDPATEQRPRPAVRVTRHRRPGRDGLAGAVQHR